MEGGGSELEREERVPWGTRSRCPGRAQQPGGTDSCSSAGAAEHEGATIRNEIGRRRAGKCERNSAPTRKSSTAGTRMCDWAPLARPPPLRAVGAHLRPCARPSARGRPAGPPTSVGRQPGPIPRFAGGLPIGAGWCKGNVPGRDGDRRHAHVCGASGEEGVSGRRSASEMES